MLTRKSPPVNRCVDRFHVFADKRSTTRSNWLVNRGRRRQQSHERHAANEDGRRTPPAPRRQLQSSAAINDDAGGSRELEFSSLQPNM